MSLRSQVLRIGLFLLLGGIVAPLQASADTIAVIGTGDVAKALGPEFAAQGHDIVYGSRDPARDSVRELVAATGHGATAVSPAEAASDADIVVMAVPGGVIEAVTTGLGDLSGKIIIDPTNAIGRGEDGFFEIAVETSNAELIQGWAPDAHVVKAFNTLNWRTMIDPESSGGPVSIPLVGDNDEAKSIVADLVSGMGLEPIDLGPLRYARHVEGMLIVWINNRYAGGEAFDYYLRKTPATTE
jgi:predicted dinucleotide-binding enzyme